MEEFYLKTRLHCTVSGLYIGQLEFLTTAGTQAYLSHWNGLIAKHPVFSMDFSKLVKFARSEWDRLAQRASEDALEEGDSNILRVTFLALLHSMDCIKQDHPVLPPLATVVTHMKGVLYLSTWKFHLESKRFVFPTLHLSKHNANERFENLKDYLDVCFAKKEEYETAVRKSEDEEKVRMAERAAAALSSSWVTPVSKKLLWDWVQAHLPERYQVDGMYWMADLFLGSRSKILEFDKDEIDMLEEIVCGECPAGTGVMFAVRTRIEQVRAIWTAHYEEFEIDLADYADQADILVNGERKAPPDPGEEPQMRDFKSKAEFYVAKGTWHVAKAAHDKYWREQERKKQRDAELRKKLDADDDTNFTEEDI